LDDTGEQSGAHKESRRGDGSSLRTGEREAPASIELRLSAGLLDHSLERERNLWGRLRNGRRARKDL